MSVPIYTLEQLNTLIKGKKVKGFVPVMINPRVMGLAMVTSDGDCMVFMPMITDNGLSYKIHMKFKQEEG